MVTSETVGTHFVLVMTRNTSSHRNSDRGAELRRRSLAHIAVTVLAPKFAERDVAAVREVDVARRLIDSTPRDLLALFDEVSDLLGLGTSAHLSAMTGGADLERRNAGEFGLLHRLMAKHACQATLNVGLMVELNRLDNDGARVAGAERDQTHEHRDNLSKPQ